MLPIDGLMWEKRHFPWEQGSREEGARHRVIPHILKTVSGAPWLLRQETEVGTEAGTH